MMQTVSVMMHLVSFLLFFGAALYSYRAARVYSKAKDELQDLYKEGKVHIEKLAHEGNKEVLKWVLRNADRQ